MYVYSKLTTLDLFQRELSSFSETLKKKRRWHHELMVNFGVLTLSLVHILPVKNFKAWQSGICVFQHSKVTVCEGNSSLFSDCASCKKETVSELTGYEDTQML